MAKSKSWGAIGAMVLGASVWGASLGTAHATPVVYNFDGFADSEVLGMQLAGLSFSNATVLSAGLSLNEFEFPPASGDNVVVVTGTSMTIDFASPVFSVSGLFTYLSQLTFEAFDGVTSLGSVSSSSSDNRLSVGMPNEVLTFSSMSGSISRIVITGASGANAFVMDNLTVDSGLTTLPEPATLALLTGVLGLGVLPGGWMRRRRSY